MAKMIFSLGFWMTIVLFIALGFAIGHASGSECEGSMNCGVRHVAFASSTSSVDNPHFENDLGASDVDRRRRCAANATSRSDYPDFQVANLQAGGPTYAPGFSLTLTRKPPQASLCPGPIEISRH
jgi:hypothetical protein